MAEPLEGRTPWDAYPDAMRPQDWDEHRADVAARRPFRGVEMDIELPDGTRRIVALSGVPRFDGKGRFLGYHGIGRDITMRREAERLLLRHNETLQRSVAERTQALERVNRDLDAFARQLAHELRTPISHVEGLTHLIQSRMGEQLTEDGRSLIQMQLRATQQMRETLDALLLLARSTMQAMPMTSVDVSALARAVIAELPPIARQAPVQWHVTEGLHAHAAPAALRMVLVNLLGNAAKFTRETAQPQVWVDGRCDDAGWFHLRVRDNGAGFDPAYTERLFKPFARLHSTDRFGGTGIGLSIVQRIVERHGGRVQAHGAVQAGAQFDLSLPPAAPQPAALPEPVVTAD
jgi:signal transduction histidine kinase